MNRLIKLAEVMHITSLSKQQIYTRIRKGEFPQAIRVANNCVAWSLVEVEAWVEDIIAASKTEAGQQAREFRRARAAAGGHLAHGNLGEVAAEYVAMDVASGIVRKANRRRAGL